jgi:hypothetical protein
MSIAHLDSHENLLDNYSQSQRERLNFIDFRVFFTGQIRRTDLIARFGIKEAAATRDLSSYQKNAPDNIEYDSVQKTYLKTDKYERYFIKDIDAKYLLLALVHGLGDDFATLYSTPIIPCELPVRLNTPHIEIFAAVSRAIYNKKALKISYISQRSGNTSRIIIPFSIAGNGLRWHVRAYDRKRHEFCDFIINRITKAEILTNETINEVEFKENDIEWNRRIELEIVPHPNLPSKDFIEKEFDMKEGVMRYKVRAAMAGYVLRLWNVDCSSDHKLKGDEYHLWLQNVSTLYEVSSLRFAPGYEPQTS